MSSLLLAKPTLLQFETATSCNGKCIFCEHPKMKQRPPTKWSNLIDLIYNYAPKVRAIVPFGMQEPFLEPRLTAVLTNIKQMNRHVETTVYTNMTIYNEKVMRRLIEHQCLDKLVISFYGTDKHAYNKLQPHFDFYQVQKNIRNFMRLRKRLGWRKPRVVIHLLTTPETIPKANAFTKKWRRIVDEVGFVHYDGWCGKQPYNSALEQKIWGIPAPERYPCHRLWTTMTVRCDGSMVPCCLDAHIEMPLANAFTDKDPFNSQAMQELRKLHVEGKQDQIPLCKNCTVWRYEEPEEWKKQWIKQKNAVSAPILCT